MSLGDGLRMDLYSFNTPQSPEYIKSYEIKIRGKLKNIYSFQKQRIKCIFQKKAIKKEDFTKHDLAGLLNEFYHSCAYCGFPFVINHDMLEFDHVVPICLGGEHSLRNLVPSCRDCNNLKSIHHPKQWFESKNISAVRIDKIREHWKKYS